MIVFNIFIFTSLSCSNLFSELCVVFQLVLWGTRLSKVLTTQHGEWRCHGSGLFHGPHRRDASLLQSYVCSLWHWSLLPSALGWPRSLDLLQYLLGHHEHNVDAQDCPWLLQSAAFRTPEQSRRTSGERQDGLGEPGCQWWENATTGAKRRRSQGSGTQQLGRLPATPGTSDIWGPNVTREIRIFCFLFFVFGKGAQSLRCTDGPFSWPSISHENYLLAILCVHGHVFFSFLQLSTIQKRSSWDNSLSQTQIVKVYYSLHTRQIFFFFFKLTGVAWVRE